MNNPRQISTSPTTSRRSPLRGKTASPVRSQQEPLIADIPWQDDHDQRMNPSLVTRLLHRAVPVLRSSNWRIDSVEPGSCTTVLPLNQATTNQHGTHQAALISLSADYTGGVALASLLRGVPIGGVHRPGERPSALLWLAGMDVRYQQPSTGHLIGRCEIDDAVAAKIVDRYSRGKRVLVTLPMTFESNDQVVAKAEMKYFAMPAGAASGNSEPSALDATKLKASARMIAGVRACSFLNTMSTAGEPIMERTDRPFDRAAAGPHGLLLAGKLQAALPQLSNMVSARTSHGDQLLHSMPELKQVVLVGAGLDMRPYRLKDSLPNVRYFELDLPVMLAERQRVIAKLSTTTESERVQLAANFHVDAVDDVLRQCEQFDASLPTAFIYEGCAMYFDEESNVAMLSRLASLMQHPASRLWVDFVSHDAVSGGSGQPAVNEFLGRMADMGEAFVFGLDNPHALLDQCGLMPTSIQSSLDYLNVYGQPDAAIYDLYSFTVAKAK